METNVNAQIRRLIEVAHQRQLAQIAALSDAERDEVGTPERWSAKDHLAHTMYWKRRLAGRLAAAQRGETPEGTDDFQPLNEVNFAEQRDRLWADVLADDARIHADLLTRLDALAEDDLVDPARFPWSNGEPLLNNVLGNTYWHAQEHLAQYRRDRGDLAGATQVHETWVREFTQLPVPAFAKAGATYNLACFYATTGRASKALELLGEALRLDPKLTEWSKQDPDFAALRGDPAYQALYAS